MSNYSKDQNIVRELIIRMTDQRSHLRPNCEDMLKEEILKPLTSIHEEIQKTIYETKSIEDSFHKFFIQTKLSHNFCERKRKNKCYIL